MVWPAKDSSAPSPGQEGQLCPGLPASLHGLSANSTGSSCGGQQWAALTLDDEEGLHRGRQGNRRLSQVKPGPRGRGPRALAVQTPQLCRDLWWGRGGQGAQEGRKSLWFPSAQRRGQPAVAARRGWGVGTLAGRDGTALRWGHFPPTSQPQPFHRTETEPSGTDPNCKCPQNTSRGGGREAGEVRRLTLLLALLCPQHPGEELACSRRAKDICQINKQS